MPHYRHKRLAARLHLKRQRSRGLGSPFLLVQTARRDNQRHNIVGECTCLLDRFGHLDQMAVINAGDQHGIDLDLDALLGNLPDAFELVLQQKLCCLPAAVSLAAE
ncbi:hypothetical protein D3C71_1506820 [compost metagenome]